MAGVERPRSIGDEYEATRRAELDFLRKVKKTAMNNLAKLRSRSASSPPDHR
jgi:hypothetical protein